MIIKLDTTILMNVLIYYNTGALIINKIDTKTNCKSMTDKLPQGFNR